MCNWQLVPCLYVCNHGNEVKGGRDVGTKGIPRHCGIVLSELGRGCGILVSGPVCQPSCNKRLVLSQLSGHLSNLAGNLRPVEGSQPEEDFLFTS